MDKKEYLSRYHNLIEKIERKKQYIAFCKEQSHAIPGQDFSVERVDHTPSFEAPFVKWIEKKSEVDNNIVTLQKDLERLKVEILQVIEKLENEDHKNVLIMRYLDTQTWEKIAENLYCSTSTVKRWHKNAVELLKL